VKEESSLEPSFPSPQETKMVEMNHKTKKPIKIRSFIVVFAVVFSMFSLLEVLGLGNYASFAAGPVAALVVGVLLSKASTQSSKYNEMNGEKKQ